MTEFTPILSSDYQNGIIGQPATDRITENAQQQRDFKAFPVDWRFLPEELLVAKDWLRFQWINTVGIERRSTKFQTFWGATFARHLVKPIGDAGILFVHIPRTAGTSMCSQLYGRNIPHLPVVTWKGLLGAQASRVQSFSIVRDPEERLISLYAFIKQGGTKLMAAPRYDPWNLSSAVDFDDFLDRLWSDKTDRWRPVYLRPQCHCVHDSSGAIAVDRLFSFKAARGLPAELSNWLGIAAMPKHNASQLPEVHVSSTLRSKIEQHYAEDFGIFQRIEDSGGILMLSEQAERLQKSSELSETINQ